MMKGKIFCLYLFILSIANFSFGQDTASKEVAERIKKISAHLMRVKKLPAPFEERLRSKLNGDDLLWLNYKTLRSERGISEDVEMEVRICYKSDSLLQVLFIERHKQNKTDWGMVYYYLLSREGMINQASYQDFSNKEDSIIGMCRIPEQRSYTEIDDFNKPSLAALKPDEKTFEKYNSKLNVTLDELERLERLLPKK